MDINRKCSKEIGKEGSSKESVGIGAEGNLGTSASIKLGLFINFSLRRN